MNRADEDELETTYFHHLVVVYTHGYNYTHPHLAKCPLRNFAFPKLQLQIRRVFNGWMDGLNSALYTIRLLFWSA
jgi:hypothetical protein